MCAVVMSFIAITAMKTGSDAEFKFEEETHDFGKLTQGKEVQYDFKFTNTGDAPLIVSSVEASCGCTVPEYSKLPVKKGQTGTITTKFSAPALGPFTKTITVKSNARTPVKVLYIKGEVVAAATGK